MKQKSYTDEFLTLFKTIELKIQEIYGKDKTFKDLELICETNGDITNAKKMQLCRIIRNYASHNPDINDFLPIQEETYNYLGCIYRSLDNQTKKVKDVMSRIKPLTLKDNLVQGAKRLSRLPEVPVVDESGIIVGIFTNDVLRKCVEDEISMKSRFTKEGIKLKQIVSTNCVERQMNMSDIDKKLKETKILYVTDNGKISGKFIGVIAESTAPT